MKRIALVLSLAILSSLCAQAKTFKLTSPDKRIVVEVSDGNALTWSVSRDGKQILLPSEIALDVKGVMTLGEYCKVKSSYRERRDEMLTAVVPTRFREVRDNYNGLALTFDGGWTVRFRAYNNGVAYRFETNYLLPQLEVLGEKSEWVFAGDYQTYWANEGNPDYITHCEADFKEMPLSQIGSQKYSYLPVSMKTDDGLRLAITEADLFDYPNMMLRAGAADTLKAEFPHVIDKYDMRGDRDVTITKLANCIARTPGTRTYPWRVMEIGSDADLLENTLAWQLSSAEAPGDYSWIRPGKISWEWWAMLNVYGVDFRAGVNTDTYKYYIDFAAAYGLEYILLDEGWSASTLNIVESNPDLDLAELISYGKTKGVGIVLWTLWTPMMADLENILDTYRDWGVAGIKIDFMQMQDQNMVRFYEDVARECCSRGLVVDYHGAFKPAGLQRKYPNAMTYEGVYGMEHDKCSYDISPDHDLQLPFTRMVAGPMDYTPGAVNNATKADFAIRWDHPMSQGTRSHQAALFVVFESPLMMLCDSPSNYYKAPEFAEFLSQIPTVWDKTIAHQAEAGEYVLESRKTADGRWYSAALTNWQSRDLELDTAFLGNGIWEVTIHRDGVNADRWAEDYKIEKKLISAGDILPIHMAPGGGWAAEFVILSE